MSGDLIARLEAATGPDPRLDAEIEAALHGGVPAYRSAARHQFGPAAVLNHDAGNPWDGWESARSYTGSLDAARTLVPPGFDFNLLFQSGERAEAIIYLKPFMQCRDEDRIIAEGRTLELALCVAAIKARASR